MTDIPAIRITQVYKAEFMVGGKPAPVYALGVTPEDAERKAKEWWLIETAKAEGSSTNQTNTFVGKIWMVNHWTKEKKRVDPSEVDAMLAVGWAKGGPRTQFE